MPQSGYYEIIHHMDAITGLKMRAMAGNVQFNRLHWHDSLEIMCCIHGSFTMKLPDASYTLQEGDLITVDSGLPHEILDGTRDGLQLIFSVDASMLRLKEQERYRFSTVGPDALPKDYPDIRTVRSTIARLIGLQPPESDEQWYRLHMELYRLLTALSRHKGTAAAASRPTGSYSRFLQCVEILHRDYRNPISAATLAEELGFSEPTIYRLFHTHMGMSFTKYLNSVRISAACGMLESAESEAPDMTELAASCGFTSLSNFYRTFQQFTHMSPRDYRKLSSGAAEAYRTDRALTPDARTALASLACGTGTQQELMSLNRFQPLWELPAAYRDDIRTLASSTIPERSL